MRNTLRICTFGLFSYHHIIKINETCWVGLGLFGRDVTSFHLRVSAILLFGVVHNTPQSLAVYLFICIYIAVLPVLVSLLPQVTSLRVVAIMLRIMVLVFIK